MSFDLAFGNWGFTLCLRILTFTWAFSWHLKVSSWQLFYWVWAFNTYVSGV